MRRGLYSETPELPAGQREPRCGYRILMADNDDAPPSDSDLLLNRGDDPRRDSAQCRSAVDSGRVGKVGLELITEQHCN